MRKIIKQILAIPLPFSKRSRQRGQSFLELAIILPILLLMLLGLVEVSFFIGQYLDILDLTREAARFASVRDPFITAPIAQVSCSSGDPFNFYFHTACIFSPPTGSPKCTDAKFCNGLNSLVTLDPAVDDVLITVFTITNWQVSSPVFPLPDNYWALSNNDADTAHNDNWKQDCQGNIVRSTPYFTPTRINNTLEASSPKNKGLVVVEFYYCYHQALNLPVVTNFIPNPLRIHAYTLMPIPAASPSPTPQP
jgi:hypothetical protein